MSQVKATPFHVLFVCTGNIFRSMSAEYALRKLAIDRPYIVSSSAGIEAKQQSIHPEVISRLALYGIDPSGHVQRKVSREILSTTSLVVSMGVNHHSHLEREFGQRSQLFMELATGEALPVLDVDEAVPNWKEDSVAAQRHVHSVIDDIVTLMPSLLSEIETRIRR